MTESQFGNQNPSHLHGPLQSQERYDGKYIPENITTNKASQENNLKPCCEYEGKYKTMAAAFREREVEFNRSEKELLKQNQRLAEAHKRIEGLEMCIESWKKEELYYKELEQRNAELETMKSVSDEGYRKLMADFMEVTKEKEAYFKIGEKMADYIHAWATFSNGEPEAKKLFESWRILAEQKEK